MSYAVTKSRVSQYIGIILILAVFAGAYWYFQVYGSTLNQSQNDLNTNGLVGMWSFNGDDISGTTAYDRGTGGNNGTLTNGPAVTSGKVGQALSFDGVNDNVSVAYAASICPSNITVGTWVKFTSLTTTTVSGGASINEMYLLGKRNNSDNTDAYVFYKGSDQKISFSVNSYLNYAVSTTAVVAGQWYHIAGVYDGATIKMYVNGILEGTTTYAGGAISCNAEALTLGRRYPSAAYDAYLNGSLDEVRLYNRAIAGSEVASLYAQGNGTKSNTSISQPQGTGRLDSGLAGYWRLDDGSGTSATDSSTNSVTSTLTNGPAWTTGQIGGAVDFDGTDDYIELGSSIRVNSSDRGVFAAWINIDTNSPSNKYLFGYGGGAAASAAKFTIYIDGSTDTVAIEQASTNFGTYNTVRGSTALGTGTWYHVAVVSNGSTYSIYVNSQIETITVSGGSNNGNWLGDTSPTSTVHSVIGAAYFNGAYTGHIDAKIDEARLYDRPFSPDEISQLYRLTTPTAVDTSLKGYWSFNAQDMPTSTTAADRSGAGNTGTLNNGPTITEGKIGQALSFDGTDDSINIPYNASLNQTSAITLSAWIRTTATGRRDIITRTATFGAYNGYSLLLGDDYYSCSGGSSGKLAFFMGTGGGTSLCSVSTVNDGNWHFMVATYDGTTARLYIDGVLNSSGAMGNGLNNTSSTLYIGRAANPGGWFNGLIDEVRIYNRALSAAEIKSLYDMGESDKINSSVSQAQGTGRLDSGLAGYWALDDGSGTSATDSSTNGNTGTLTSGPTWATGQVGGAVNFDGTDDYIIKTSLGLITNTFTVSLWAKMSTNVSNDYIFDYRAGLNSLIAFRSTPGQNDIFVRDASSNTPTGGQVSPGFLYDGSWHLYTITADGTNVRAFRDGVQQGAASGWTNSISTGSTLTLGASNNGGSDHFQGSLDEIRIYNRALSADEVSQLYRLNAPTGTETSLKGYWSFNGKDISGTTAYDRSGSGNNGTLTSGPSITEGRIGQGLSFDGVDDYIVTSSPPVATGEVSVFVWMKANNVSTQQGIVGDVTSGDTPGMYALYLGTTSGKINAFWNGSFSNVCPGNQTLVAGVWYHVGFVRTGSSGNWTCKTYVNGVLDNTTTGITNNPANVANFTIGKSGTRKFGGALDEVRIYNRAFSADEVAALYNTSR